MKISSARTALAAMAVTFGAVTSGSSFAQENYPSKPIRLVVSQQAGGSTDSVARLWAEKVGKLLQANVVVENKPGAGGAIAAQAVLSQPADGYTLFLAGVSQMVLNKFVYKPLAYSPENDFVGVALLTTVPFALVANPATGFKTFDDLKTAAKAKPGSINFASSGNGNSTQLVIEIVQKQAGIAMTHVPYKGEPDGVMATAGGQTQVMAPVFSTALPLIRSGKLTPLVLFGAVRSPDLPNVPTAAEVGLTGLENIGWSGIAAKAGTPPVVIEKLHAATQKMLDDPDTIKRLNDMQVRPMKGPSTELMRITVRDTAKWQEAIGNLDLNVK
jgi:tripartite-type tricarboxylate transporter receptor subunit TctC